MFAPDVLAYVLASLGDEPRKVLEVGAGRGELAVALRERGHRVTAVDPKGEQGVRRQTLLETEADDGLFDAAVAIVSLHHLEPLAENVAHLAGLLAPGAPLVVDEIDVDRLDERAAAWWLGQQAALGNEHHRDETPAGLVHKMRHHVHSLATVVEALRAHFTVGEPVRGAYLHRWHLPPGLRDYEEALIGEGRLPAMGARLVAVKGP